MGFLQSKLHLAEAKWPSDGSGRFGNFGHDDAIVVGFSWAETASMSRDLSFHLFCEFLSQLMKN